MWITIITSLIIIEAKRYNIEDLNFKPGLYFAKKQSLTLITESWTIAVDYNLEEIEEKQDHLETIWKATLELRNKSTGTMWTNAQFQGTLNEMMTTKAKIRRLHELTGAEPTSRNRKRRGIFNSIGFGLKTLFGTMDSDDAEYYNEKISTIDSNQGRVYQLEKDQLTLVRRTLADVKHTLKDINTNQDTIIHSQVLLEELQELTKLKIDTYQEQLNVYNKIVSALQVLELANKEIDRLVTDLYISIDFMRNGYLSTLLISPDDLISYLNDISIHLKYGSTLPLVVTKQTVHEYYELIRVAALLVENRILRFFLNVPLRHSAQPYNLFEILPVPTPPQGLEDSRLYTFIQPKENYLAISSDETQFFLMSQRQINQCRGKLIKACFGPHIVNNLVTGLETCETAYYKRLKPSENSCDSRLTYLSTSVWTEIKETKWIFVIPQEELITITCPGLDGYPELDGTEWIHGTGILTLPATCQMKGSTFTIFRRVVFKSRVEQNVSDGIIIPRPSNFSLPIANNNYVVLAKKLKNATAHVRFVTTTLDELDASSIRLDTLNSYLNDYQIDNQVVHPTHYLSLLSLIIIFIFIVYYFRVYKLCNKAKCRSRPKAVECSKDSEANDVESHLENMPLEDRIKFTRKSKKEKNQEL